ncbi:MAG: hypothetical protein ABW056_05655 [Thermoanaerobaculia bacterium]
MIETLSHPAQSAEFLSRRHDGELAADEAAAFEAHRLECAECQASVAEFENALAAYRSAPVTPHASDLSARILRKIRATSPSRRPFGVMFGIDVRWAGALAAALLVVIIGAPVFSRREMRARPEIAAERPASAPIPAYVLDAEEERPSEKSAELKSRSSPETPPASAPKAEAAPPARAADDSAAAAGVHGFATEGARETDSRRDELAAMSADNANKPDQPSVAQKRVAQEPAAPGAPPPPSLHAAAPAAAETKELARSNTARRQSASAPVGGEAGAGASADETPVVVKLTIHPVDGEGEPPDVVQTPSDERLAVFRGRKYLLVVESGGRVVAVSERPAGRKLAKDKVSDADAQTAARVRSLADTVLRELAFQPGDRPRRLVVDIR